MSVLLYRWLVAIFDNPLKVSFRFIALRVSLVLTLDMDIYIMKSGVLNVYRTMYSVVIYDRD